MQLSARILTALAVLAFVVGVVVGTRGATDEVSAATGTIDALNMGTCTTTNADVFSFDDDCLQPTAFFQQNPIEDLIEVDTLYSTYAHDPRTAAESPRAILEDSDTILISVTDKGRDRRDPVLVTTAEDLTGVTGLADIAGIIDASNGVEDGTARADGSIPIQWRDRPDDTTDAASTVDESTFDPQSIVAEAVGFTDPDDLPTLEQQVEFDGSIDIGGGTNTTNFATSGTYEIIWEREGGGTPPETDDFKPIAPDGVVKFFGRINDGIAAPGGDGIDGFGPFKDLGSSVVLDEDVISGEPDEPPVMTVNVSVPDETAARVLVQVIYYETSGFEFIIGGGMKDDPDGIDDICIPNLHLEMAGSRTHQQAACTADEIEADAGYVLHAESDEDAVDQKRHLALKETGRFTGIFQGRLRLTDADGDGTVDAGSDNWGLEKVSATYDDTASPPTIMEAVLGVGNGPVTITYKDTNGVNRTHQIEIDITPPTITVDSPAHGGRSDDEKPSFIGTFNDSDSGLQANSFQLDVDNTPDEPDANPVIKVDSGVTPQVAGQQVRRRQDYAGYATTPQFGIVGLTTPDVLYKVEHVPAQGDSEDWKSLDADDFDDGAADGEFNGEIEIDFDEFSPPAGFLGFNNAVDFQALVRDLAGNVGFSDSEPTAPRFINALGEEEPTDRDPVGETHNVLGVFSRHVVHIDELDPRIILNASVTGFYDLDDDDNPVRDRSAVMVVFDNSVNGELIDTGTFTLQRDEETAIEIVDVAVEGKLVFLKLGEELASDATPSLTLSEGREVEDLAGNLLTWQEPLDGELDGPKVFEVRDGIQPVFTVTLSGGSGTGVGSESSSRLTSGAMDIAIESDEDINGSPLVSLVCDDIQWVDGAATKKLSDYVGNRTGYSARSTSEPGLSCGGATNPDTFRPSASLARPGNNWVYAWRNTSSPARHLNDGKIVVVVWGSDRSKFVEHKDDFCGVDPRPNVLADKECSNFGSQTVEFTLDSIFNSPLNADGSGGSVQPADDSEVKEPRPFVYLDFAGEMTSVTVTELSVDGEDVLAELDSVGDNRYLYWPEALAFGTHKVEFDARDAANNEPEGRTSFEFDVTARDPFVIDLTAGWNAVSVPADPVDTALDAVFTEEAVDRVVGWNPLSATGPWSIATRIDGVWTTSANFAPLTDIVVRYGYWVHSAAFVEQSVDLKGQLDRESGDNPAPIGIITVPGWNFVGVVDQDGDQTEDNFDEVLQTKEADLEDPTDITADDYMPGFRQAYTWDAIANGYRVLAGDDNMTIGDGVWVFFPDGTTVAP